MPQEKRKLAHKPSQGALYCLSMLLRGLLVFCVCVFSLYFCYFSSLLFYNTVLETITHYPDSRLIWSGVSHPYGSSDYGTRIFYRWTDDSVESVEAYYSTLPEQWQASAIAVDELQIENLSVCVQRLGGFFRHDDIYDFNSPLRSEGCEVLNANLPSYGTLIELARSEFVG